MSRLKLAGSGFVADTPRSGDDHLARRMVEFIPCPSPLHVVQAEGRMWTLGHMSVLKSRSHSGRRRKAAERGLVGPVLVTQVVHAVIPVRQTSEPDRNAFFPVCARRECRMQAADISLHPELKIGFEPGKWAKLPVLSLLNRELRHGRRVRDGLPAPPPSLRLYSILDESVPNPGALGGLRVEAHRPVSVSAVESGPNGACSLSGYVSTRASGD